MPVRLIVTMRAEPGRGTELLTAMRARCAAVRTEPGCIQFDIFQSPDDPDFLCLLELWDDQPALDAHAALNARANSNPRVANLLAEGALTREDYKYLSHH